MIWVYMYGGTVSYRSNMCTLRMFVVVVVGDGGGEGGGGGGGADAKSFVCADMYIIESARMYMYSKRSIILI